MRHNIDSSNYRVIRSGLVRYEIFIPNRKDFRIEFVPDTLVESGNRAKAARLKEAQNPYTVTSFLNYLFIKRGAARPEGEKAGLEGTLLPYRERRLKNGWSS